MTSATSTRQCARSVACKRPAQWRITQLHHGRLYLENSTYGAVYCKQHAKEELWRQEAAETNEARALRTYISNGQSDVIGQISRVAYELDKLNNLIAERLNAHTEGYQKPQITPEFHTAVWTALLGVGIDPATAQSLRLQVTEPLRELNT
jgi:hypothetical protein